MPARFPLAALVLAAGCARAAAAPTVPGGDAGAPRTVLVELFTSQGCSSCPAADAFVRELPSLGLSRTRVVPLTFHVDYWNELGWPDPFSSPAFTERQRRYGQAGQLRGPSGDESPMTGLYTPQMIVDGKVHFSGRRRDLALAEIARAAAAPARVELEGAAVVDGDRATVTLRPHVRAGVDARDLQVFVALAEKAARTRVPRGENRGETLDEAAVVRALSAPAPLPGAGAATTLTVTKPRDLPWSAVELAAVVQSPRTMQVATVLALEPHAPPRPPTGDAR